MRKVKKFKTLTEDQEASPDVSRHIISSAPSVLQLQYYKQKELLFSCINSNRTRLGSSDNETVSPGLSNTLVILRPQLE